MDEVSSPSSSSFLASILFSVLKPAAIIASLIVAVILLWKLVELLVLRTLEKLNFLFDQIQHSLFTHIWCYFVQRVGDWLLNISYLILKTTTSIPGFDLKQYFATSSAEAAAAAEQQRVLEQQSSFKRLSPTAQSALRDKISPNFFGDATTSGLTSRKSLKNSVAEKEAALGFNKLVNEAEKADPKSVLALLAVAPDAKQQLGIAQQLYEQLCRERDETTPDMQCLICRDSLRKVICLPCGHMTTCVECMQNLQLDAAGRKLCPICRKRVQEEKICFY